MCEALSSKLKTAKFSPMEIWRPGYTITPYGLPTMKDIAPKHLQHFEDQKKLAQMINDTVKANNEAYLKRMDERPSNVRKVKAIRSFSLGDTVTRIMESGNKTIDKLSDLQTGPYEVVEIDPSGIDYFIKRLGSSSKPIRCHINDLNLFKSFTVSNTDQTAKDLPATVAKEYTVERVMGSKDHSARPGGGKSFLIQWANSTDGTVHKCSWEPEENITHAAQLLREYYKLSVAERKTRLTEARTIGINAVSLSEHKLSDDEWPVLTDLSQADYDHKTLLQTICTKVGIEMSQVLFVWASPPCNTVSPCGAVNQLRGSAYRYTHSQVYRQCLVIASMHAWHGTTMQ